MVDIKDTSALATGLNDKIESVPDVADPNFIDDEPMDNLAYSDSESASVAMPDDDDFCDALDLVDEQPIEENQSAKGKLTVFFFFSFQIIVIKYFF